jgi:integrase
MYLDADRGGYAVRNPITGKKKRFSDEGKARKMAGLMAEWVAAERQAQAFDAGKPKIAGTVDAWIRDRMPFMPWDEGTRYAITCKLKRIRRELGDRILSRTDRLFLDDWLTSFCRTADQWNKWRYVLVLLWDYAIAKKLAEVNEAEKLLERSTSKKLAMNQKVRQKLDEEGFQAIHGKAPTWLQIAMEQSLVTLQARTEVCNMRHVDYRGGYLFVIRDKVSGDSDMAFIKIAITPELEDIRRRSMLDAVLSPYLVHRSPSRQRREWTEGKPHWTYVNPEYLSKAFAEARDETKRFEHLKAPERPTFHEIRGLGARTYRARGIPESEVQALMTHANPRTTQIYLERGAAALTDDDYIAVKAPLSVREMLRAKGKT